MCVPTVAEIKDPQQFAQELANALEPKVESTVKEQLEAQFAEKIDGLGIMRAIEELQDAVASGPPQQTTPRMWTPPGLTSGASDMFPEQAALREALGTGNPYSYNPDAIGAELDGEFEDFADFVRAVIRSDMQRERDPRLVRVNGAGEKKAALTGEELDLGGNLVPEEFRPRLMMLMLQPTSIRPRCMSIPMGSSSIKLPTIRSESHANGQVFGGIEFYWTQRRARIERTEPDFAMVELTARGLKGAIDLPNELIMDSFISVPSMMMTLWSMAVPWIEEMNFLRGSGAAQPLGILNCDARVQVARNGGGNAFELEDAAKMLARMMPGSRGRAVWMMNQEIIPDLVTMTNGQVQAWQPALREGMPDTFLGRPLIWNEHMSASGEEGDVALVDWMYYIIADRMALTMRASEHEEFSDDMTVMRGVTRFDSQPWLDTPLTPAQGDDKLSPFVILQ